MKCALAMLLVLCLPALALAGDARANYWSAAAARNTGWSPRGAQGTVPAAALGAAYGYGSPYNRYGASYGYGMPSYGFGGGYMGAGYGGGYGYGGYGYGAYPGYANYDGYGPSGMSGRFYYGAPQGNGGFGYGPNGYGNNDTSTYRYRGTSALPQVPPFANFAQPSPLAPYSYIYADKRTPQAPPHPETLANPFVHPSDAGKAPSAASPSQGAKKPE